jgi:hypothetical protein
MMFGSSCAILMKALLRLSLCVEILITCNIKLFLRNLVNRLMIAFLDLNQLLAAYIHVILLLILIMNVLNNCCMLLMILFVA